MLKPSEYRIMKLEAKVKSLEKQKVFVEKQAFIADNIKEAFLI